MAPTEFHAIRTRLGYSQSQAAEAIGCSTRQVVRIEAGEPVSGPIGNAWRRHEALVLLDAEARIPERRVGRPAAA